MDVSVIVVTRNTWGSTKQAIESVMRGAAPLAFELLVVDNASSDETQVELPKHFPSARYLRMESNTGFARAVNLAARDARGEFLLLLNSDARLQPEALPRAVAFLQEQQGCGIAGAQLLTPEGRKQNSIANFPSLATELLNKYLLRTLWPQRFPGKEQTYTRPVEVESVIGAFFLTRRALWEQLRGMDERFFFFFEETDYCLRARQAGYTTMHLPDVLVFHEQGRTARHDLPGARIEYWKSRYAYFQKHASSAVRGVLRAGLLARLAVDSFASALMTLLSVGAAAKWRQRFAVHRALWRWHLRGCLADEGLER